MGLRLKSTIYGMTVATALELNICVTLSQLYRKHSITQTEQREGSQVSSLEGKLQLKTWQNNNKRV